MFFLKKKTYYGYFIGTLGVVLFSTKAILAKLAYSFDADYLSILFLRMVYSLPIYGFLLFLEIKKSKTSPKKNSLTRKDGIHIILLGIIGYYLSSFFDFKGLEKIDASLERLILFTYPTFTLITSFFIFNVTPSKKQLIAIVFTYGGIAFLFGENIYSSQLDVETLLGGKDILISSFLYGAYLALASPKIKKIGSKKFTIYVMLVSCIAFITHFVVVNHSIFLDVRQEIYLIGFFMAIFSTVLPSFLVAYAISLIGSNNTAIMGTFGPVSTILLAYFILGERLAIFEILGGGIIFFGIYFLTKKGK